LIFKRKPSVKSNYTLEHREGYRRGRGIVEGRVIGKEGDIEVLKR
jgi:hypothetical protein